MKRILSLTLALLLLAGLCACGAKTETPDEPAATDPGATTQVNDATETTTQPAETPAEEAKLTGQLNFISLDDRNPSILRGVSVYGNRVGSAKFNGKDPATEGIRCIFELNEYVGFVLDTDVTNGLKVWILKHRDDQKSYETADFSDLTPGFVQVCDLHVDVDNPDNESWGEFYLHPEECEPGAYDFVFVYEGKAIATLLTRFYNIGELEAKPDAELETLMFGQ